MSRLLAGLMTFCLASAALVGLDIEIASPASAASGISCNGVVCSAEGAVFGSSGTNGPVPPTGGGGGSSSGGSSSSKVTYSFQPCLAWTGNGGAAYSKTYPGDYIAQHVTNYACAISFSAGIGISCPANSKGYPPLGRVSSSVSSVINGATVTSASSWQCYYPSGPSAPVYKTTTRLCYIGGNAWFSYNGQNTGGGVGGYRTGELVSAYPGGGLSTGWNASNPTANCGGISLSFNANTKIVNGVPSFGFYTMSFQTKYVVVASATLPAWMNQPPLNTISKPVTANTTQPYTYSCQLNPALKGGVITGVSFDPATCAASQWSCQVGPITINGSNQPQQVMRNGVQITVKASPFSVSGPGVRNLSSTQYKWGMAGSPVNSLGGDINSPKQYFKLRDNPSGKVPNTQGRQELFANWYSNPNANLNKSIEFYWASEGGKPFSLTESYQFQGEFLVNTQAGLQSGSSQSWVKSFGHCSNFSSSNQVSVLRSVNSN